MLGGDEGVMSTNDECTNCKRSAVTLGYWEDPFIDLIFRSSTVERKTPEINRGYFARVLGISQTVDKFLSLVKEKMSTKCQIINLGAGYDTLFWRLQKKENTDCLSAFVDIDLPGVTSKKLCHIRCRPQLLRYLGDDIKLNALELHSNVYHLISSDIRSTQQLSDKLFKDCKINKSLPTLFISECVLIYMTSKDSNNLLSWISSTFDSCAFINYEQINIFDRFGQIMIDSLKQRNCELLDLEPCRDLNSQQSRFITNGWFATDAWDMNHVYKYGIDRDKVEKVEKLEFLDEGNLLEQLLSHYCIVIARKNFPCELTLCFQKGS